MRTLEDFLSKILCEDLGKFILRFSIGFLMLFHGYAKYQGGINWVKTQFVNAGLPEFIGYGVYLGEIVAPILIIIGLYTRISSFVFAITMVVAIYMVHMNEIFALNPDTGGLAIETPLFFLLTSLAVMFIGAGKFSFDKK